MQGSTPNPKKSTENFLETIFSKIEKPKEKQASKQETIKSSNVKISVSSSEAKNKINVQKTISFYHKAADPLNNPMKQTVSKIIKFWTLSSNCSLIKKKGFDALQELCGDQEKFMEKIQDKEFLMDKYYKAKKNIEKVRRKKIMSSKFKKSRKIFDIPEKEVNYQAFFSLNKLWIEYMNELLSAEKLQDNLLAKVLKADFHGAIIKVLHARCKSYEGQSGIVLMETLRTFKIVTTDNRLLTILKQNSIFLIELMGKNLKIYGSHLQHRAADRLRIKYKMKYLAEICSNKLELKEIE